ncbi:hypothetical protein HDE_12944 [Halotydeus destructor]|nr:hypothetical protein HDE_12944 [Halotydeus destructor]
MCELRLECYAWDTRGRTLQLSHNAIASLIQGHIHQYDTYEEKQVYQFLPTNRRILLIEFNNETIDVRYGETERMAGNFVAAFQIDRENGFATVNHVGTNSHTITAWSFSENATYSAKLSCGVHQQVKRSILAGLMLLSLYQEFEEEFTICQLSTMELRRGIFTTNGTLEARKLVQLRGLATGLAAAGGYVFVSTAEHIWQFELTRPQVLLRFMNTGFRISMLSQTKLVLTTNDKIRNLWFNGCKLTFPTIHGFRPNIIQLGTNPQISFYGLGFGSFEDSHEKTIRLDDVECYRLESPLSTQRSSMSCQLAQPFWSERKLDVQISFLISYGTTMEYVFLNAISAREVSVETVSATEYNEQKTLVDIFGKHLEGGVTQRFKLANKSCYLRDESSNHLRFLCDMPACDDSEIKEINAGRLQIGDWKLDVNVSGIDCSSPGDFDDYSILASITMVLICLSFSAGLLVVILLRRYRIMRSQNQPVTERRVMKTFNVPESSHLRAISQNSSISSVANEYEVIEYNENVPPINLVYYSDTALEKR